MNKKRRTLAVLSVCAGLAGAVNGWARGPVRETQGTGSQKTAAPARAKKSSLIIVDPWIAEGPPSMKVTAAFFRVENRTDKEAALVAVRTDAARTVELHEVVNENNMMAMRQVERFLIPAQGKFELRPGGYHLMMFGLTRTLQAGDKVDLTLKFADGSECAVTATVRKRREGDDKEKMS